MKRRLVLQTVAAIVLMTANGLAQLPVTDGILLWLDATDPTTVFQDLDMTAAAGAGDEVSVWADKSGNEFHATQIDDFFTPTYGSSVINGQPALQFDGIEGDGMAIDEGLFLERPYTAFIVNQYSGPTQGRTLQGLDSNWLLGLWNGNFGTYQSGWVGNLPAEEEFAYVTDTTGDEDSSTLFTNGQDFTVDSTPVGVPGRLGIASVGAFPAEVSDADVAEIVIYDRVLSEAELNSTREFFYNKYSTSEIELGPRDVVLAGSVGVFTGGDVGEGLDMDGEFAYAINVGGPEGPEVRDVTFLDGSELEELDGVFITDANEIPAWNSPDYGDTDNDDELESVITSIRWNTPPGVEVELDVEEGTDYKLQLMFAEACCNRGFDIFVEDEMVVDNLNVSRVQGGINNPSQGVVYSYEFTATDSTLNILLGGEDPGSSDNNPILSGLTLEIGGAGIPGDFDGNGVLDTNDIDLLTAEINTGGANDLSFDLNADGAVDSTDRIVWVEDLKFTFFGDSDFNGEFNSGDLVAVFQAGEYETENPATWNQGDWNGDGKFSSGDFVAAFQGGGFEQGPRVGAAVVPEPSSCLLLLLGGILLLGKRRS